MTAQKLRKKARKKKVLAVIPFNRENYIIFFVGVLIIIVGYVFMAQGPADSFWSLTLAPILLVISYVIIIPISILYRKKSSKESDRIEPNSGG